MMHQKLFVPAISLDVDLPSISFRLAVTSVDPLRTDICTGRVASGSVRVGDRVRIQPIGRESSVTHILEDNRAMVRAEAGQSIAIVLSDPGVTVSGDIISIADAPAGVSDQFEARLLWLGVEPMLPGRSYRLASISKIVAATITDLKYRLNDDGSLHLAAKKLELGESGVVSIATEQPIVFDAYRDNPVTGAFDIVDCGTGEHVGHGKLDFALRRASNIHMQAVDVDKRLRSALKRQKACVLWFTGLSASGKSTVANLVEKELTDLGCHTYLLDGDNVRHGLNRDLGFTDGDRVENIRRIAEVAKLMVDAGLITLVSFISPFRSERRMARGLVCDGEFFEIFVDVPLAIAEARDPKGLYRKARLGDLKNFTGIDSPYEPPEDPELHIDTESQSPDVAVDRIIDLLRGRKILPPN